MLFCDLVGFTAASERADPEDVRARIRPYHEPLRQRDRAYGGTVEKFVGDAVMAVFGRPSRTRTMPSGRSAPASDPRGLEDAERASRRSRCGPYRHQHRARRWSPWTRGPEQGEGFVTGDVVNTASRIQSPHR